MDVKFLIVHCSDSPDDQDNITAETIHRWHLNRGWDGIGYHYVINRDGTIENGRPEYWKGSHVKGYNSHSLGICVIGRHDFTDEQYTSLSALITRLKYKYKDAYVMGHTELDPNKSCPNPNIMSWIKERY